MKVIDKDATSETDLSVLCLWHYFTVCYTLCFRLL